MPGGQQMLLLKYVAPAGITFTTSSTLTPAVNGQPYTFQMNATGGTAPYWFVMTSGPTSYNNGLVFNGDGTFVGIPQLTAPKITETNSMSITVYDNAGNSTTSSFSLNIAVATGALSIPSMTLPPGVTASAYFAQVTATGGQPPYRWNITSSSGANGTVTAQVGPSASTSTKYCTLNGWLQYAPASTGTDTFAFQVEDSLFNTATISGVTVNITNSIGFQNPPRLPPGTQNAAYRYKLQGCGGSGTGYTFATFSGLPTGLTLASNGTITGSSATLGNITGWRITVTDSASNSVTVTHNISFAPQALVKVSRPSYNSSATNGFFVLGSKLYDPNGWPVTVRGFNKSDYSDNDITTGITKAAPNCIRQQVNSAVAESTTAAIVGTATSNHIMVNVMRYATSAGNSTNTSSTAASVNTILSSFLAAWVNNFSLWSPYMQKMACNFANEWGSGNPTIWQQAHQYVSAPITNITTTTITFSGASPFNTININSLVWVWIKGAGGIADGMYPVTAQGTNTITGTFPSGYTSGGTVLGGVTGVLRGCGYTCPIFLDIESDAQSLNDFSGGNAAALLAADPLQNIVFCNHAYSTSTLGCQISAVTISGSTATITFNSNATSQPLFNNSAAYGISVEGVQGITGLNGRYTVSQPGAGGAVNAWKATCTGTFSGTYTAGSGMLYVNYHYLLVEQYMASFGLCVVYEESSPGYAGMPYNENGPYYTSLPPGSMIQFSEHYGIGWTPWAWENGTTNESFGFLYSYGTYTTFNGLTWYGADVCLNPQYGLIATAVYAPSMS
jgi:hypothetical protein